MDEISLFDFNFQDIDGNYVELSTFENKPLFIVNTASSVDLHHNMKVCKNLFKKYRKTELTIIAVTSNSFNQEYSNPEDIKQICLVNYGNVGFITSSPIKVKGLDAHPMYKWLNDKFGKSPKWNFYKYLFDRSGNLVESWSSMTKPDNKKIIKQIDKLI